MIYPNRIRELREAARLSQRQLAARADTTGSEIHKLETGNRRLTQEWIAKFTEIFNVSADYLLKRDARSSTVNATKGQLPAIAAGIDHIQKQMEDLKQQLDEVRVSTNLLLETLLGAA